MTRIYLNNAASAWPKAPGVVEAVSKSLSLPPAHPGRGESSAPDVVEECRYRLARLLGSSDPFRIVLCHNATHALNLAILGLSLRAEDLVVTSVAEHNSVLRPLAHASARTGTRTVTIGLDEAGNLDSQAFDRALEGRPRLVALTHASNVTGRVNEVAPFFRKATAAGAVTLLDASQTLGLLPVNAQDLHADLVAFTGHKNLRGPQGTGGLLVVEGLDLDQFLVGGTGVRSDLRLHPADMPTRLEAGTPNLPALAGLNAALVWLEKEGPAFAESEFRVAARLREGLGFLPHVHLFDADPAPARTGIVSFRIEGWDVAETAFALDQGHGIICRSGLHCAPLIHAAIGSAPDGTIRLSPSGATTEAEIDFTIHAIGRLVA